jgi:hypothetical protein
MACLQVGCPMRCTFCATGKGGYARNLLPHEIVDQVLAVQEEFGKRVSNVGVPRIHLLRLLLCSCTSFGTSQGHHYERPFQQVQPNCGHI